MSRLKHPKVKRCNFHYLAILFLLAISHPSFSTELEGMKIFGDAEALTNGGFYGLYVLPWFQGAVSLPHDDEDGYYPKLLVGAIEQSRITTTGGHAYMVAKALGCDTSEEFCGIIHSGMLTNGHGRFVATYFKNYNEDLTYAGEEYLNLNGIHIAPYQSFKGFGQVGESMVRNWYTSSGHTSVVEDQDLDCADIGLCNGQLSYGPNDPLQFHDLGITPAEHQVAVMGAIMDRRPGSTLYFHNNLADPMMGWNDRNGKFQDYPVQESYYQMFYPYIFAAAHVAHRIVSALAAQTADPNVREHLFRTVGGGVGIKPPNHLRRNAR
ncbi:MAG: hypothetical protein ACI8VC_001290 [Candidatus Endobugula sp.]|jgi:hypothetical protein